MKCVLCKGVILPTDEKNNFESTRGKGGERENRGSRKVSECGARCGSEGCSVGQVRSCLTGVLTVYNLEARVLGPARHVTCTHP